MRGVALLAAALAVAAFATGGRDAFGRALMALGLDRTAAAILADPAWAGLALARSGREEAAAARFARAGSAANEGIVLARAGLYAQSLEALDRHLAAYPADEVARTDFDLVREAYAGTEIDPAAPIKFFSERDEGTIIAAPIARGDARAAGTGSDATNAGSEMGLPEVASRGRLGVRRVFDDHFFEANRRWLASLPDVPGEYLADRLDFERKRRAELGQGQPPAEDPR